MRERLRHEARIVGWPALAMPLTIVGGAALLDIVAAHSGQAEDARTVLVLALEMCAPMACGVLAAAACAGEAAAELRLTTPEPYTRGACFRLGLVLGWTALLALATSSVLFALRLWPMPHQLADWPAPLALGASCLIWLAPLLWCAGCCLFVTLLLGSQTVGVAILGAVWLAQVTFYRQFATLPWLKLAFLFMTTFAPASDFWLANRLALLGEAFIFFAGAWILLRRPDTLLRSRQEEG